MTGTVALWGPSDLADVGAQLRPRITEVELLRRLPGWTVRWHAPHGWERPCRMDGGLLAEPLGVHSPERAAQLDAAADLVVVDSAPVGAYDQARARWLTDPPPHAVWNAIALDAPMTAPTGYAAVRDERSRALVRGGDVAVVPDVAVLADRLVPADARRARVDYLRLMEWWPRQRPAVLVHADATALPSVRELARIVEWASTDVVRADVVLLEATPWRGDAETIDALARRGQHRLPSGLPVEDVLAAVSEAAFVITTSFAVAAAAAAYGTPWVLADLDAGQGSGQGPAAAALGDGGRHAPGLAGVVAALNALPTTKRADLGDARRALDAHFDAIAEAADQAWQARGGSAEHRWAAVSRENAALRHAYRVVRERHAHERTQLAKHSPHLREIERLQAVIAELAVDRAELAALRDTKLMRWAQPARQVYGRLTGRSV